MTGGERSWLRWWKRLQVHTAAEQLRPGLQRCKPPASVERGPNYWGLLGPSTYHLEAKVERRLAAGAVAGGLRNSLQPSNIHSMHVHCNPRQILTSDVFKRVLGCSWSIWKCSSKEYKCVQILDYKMVGQTSVQYLNKIWLMFPMSTTTK